MTKENAMAKSIEDAGRENPNLQQQHDEWRQARQQKGEDPNDTGAFRQHEQGIGAPDPGEAMGAGQSTSPQPQGGPSQGAGTLKEAVGRATGSQQSQAEGQEQREGGRTS